MVSSITQRAVEVYKRVTPDAKDIAEASSDGVYLYMKFVDGSWERIHIHFLFSLA